jgi:uncharacterized protein (UPF0332 family)
MTLQDAEFLLESGRLAAAVNRVYYCMYYTLAALALRQGFETSKHGQLIGWFNREFIATGLLDKKFGKMLKSAFQNRTRGDYDAYTVFEHEEVRQSISEARDFIAGIGSLVK